MLEMNSDHYLFFLNAITAPFREPPATLSSLPTQLLSEDSDFRTIISESRYIPPYLKRKQKTTV